jgi:probable F420-dependent oxidoreductase
MPKLRVGVQLPAQGTTYAAYARAVQEAEALGVDTLWNSDHFFPQPDVLAESGHFEAWTLLTAMAALTRRAEVGCLVTGNGYRNPALLSAMAKTVDHISGGRLILGLGAGWYEPDYQGFGYAFGTPGGRLRALEANLPIIQRHWETDMPRPVRAPIPMLIGGDGEKVTLRIVAQYANLWNGGILPDDYRHKNAVLDNWCEKIGRPPAEIERTVTVRGHPTAATYDDFVAAGAQHIILNLGAPWDLAPVEQLVQWREARLSLKEENG